MTLSMEYHVPILLDVMYRHSASEWALRIVQTLEYDINYCSNPNPGNPN